MYLVVVKVEKVERVSLNLHALYVVLPTQSTASSNVQHPVLLEAFWAQDHTRKFFPQLGIYGGWGHMAKEAY